jgi:hypothetical protein
MREKKRKEEKGREIADRARLSSTNKGYQARVTG